MMAERSKAAGLRSASDITAWVQTPLIVIYKKEKKKKKKKKKTNYLYLHI